MELNQGSLLPKLILDEMLELKSNITDITRCMSNRAHYKINDSKYQDLKSTYKTNLKTSNSLYEFKDVESVFLSDHCEERWNERVGPISDLPLLQSLFEYVITYEPDRITIENDNFAYLDETICFYYEINGTQLLVKTFYGRANIRPGIADIVRTIKFNSINDDQIYLKLSPSEINQQSFPICPTTIVTYCDNEQQAHQILYFENEDVNKKGYLFFAKMTNDLKYFDVDSVGLHNVSNKPLTYAQLALLYKLGFTNSVIMNLKHTHDLMGELQHIYKKPAIRTFKGWLAKVSRYK